MPLFACFLKMPDIAFRTKIVLKFRCIVTLELLTVQRFQALINMMGSSDVLLLVTLGLGEVKATRDILKILIFIFH